MRLLMLLAFIVPGGVTYMLPVALMRRNMEVRPEIAPSSHTIAEEVPAGRFDDVQEVALDVCPPREPLWMIDSQCHEDQTTTTSVLSDHSDVQKAEVNACRELNRFQFLGCLDKAVVCAVLLVLVSFFAASKLKRRTVVAYAREEEALRRKARLREIEEARKEKVKREKEETRDEERRAKEEEQRKKLEREYQESAKAEKKRLKAAAEEERKKQEEAKMKNDMAFSFSFFEKNDESPTWRAPGPDESGGWEEWKESEPLMDTPVPICNVLTPSKKVRRMAAARPILYLGSGTPPPRPVILDGDDDK